MNGLPQMTASDIAAWWGAIVASIVVLWDVFKWRASQVNLRVSAQPNMRTVTHSGKLDDDLNIFVEAVNNGDKSTTITHLVVKHYSNIFYRLRGKTSMQGLVALPGGTQPLPFELGPGKRWAGLIDQKEVEAKAGINGYFYCGIIHTASKNDKLVRVRIDKRHSNPTIERDARNSGARPPL